MKQVLEYYQDKVKSLVEFEEGEIEEKSSEEIKVTLKNINDAMNELKTDQKLSFIEEIYNDTSETKY